jgi:hypothetical protein
MTLTLIRRFLFVVALVALSMTPAFAYGLCSQQTLNNYVASGYGCTVGDKLFSNFAYSFTDTVLTPPVPGLTDVTVTPIPPSPVPTGPLGLDFAFNAGNFVGPGESMNLDIQYTVTVDTADFPAYTGYAITTVTTGVGGDQDTDGTVTATKNLCLGAGFSAAGGTDSANCTGVGTSFVGGTLGDNQFIISGLGYTNSGTIGIAPTTFIGVSDSIQLSGGTGLGADITDMNNEFTQTNGGSVPEPATLLLIGSALLGLGALRRKRT